MQIAGREVRRLRWSRGWTIVELAEKAKLNRNTVLNIESGKSPGSPQSLVRLAEAFCVSPEEIVTVEITDPGGREQDISYGDRSIAAS